MKGLITEIKFAYLMWKTNVRSAAQLRGAFMLQVVGMMINNLSFVLVWFVFFQAIGSLNGWNAYDVIALSGCGSFGFGAVFSFFSGGTWIPRYVETGLLDGYLLSPRNLYMRIIASKFDITAIGDVMGPLYHDFMHASGQLYFSPAAGPTISVPVSRFSNSIVRCGSVPTPPVA